ncbi:MAG: hypothetical protein IKQ91_05585, partial [Oscillospiraceae bacterium]|nr:hypothetical protein [Oscillospiraceae bacterium]
RTEAAFSAEGDLNTASALTDGILIETADIRIAEPEYSCVDVKAGQVLPMQAAVYNDGTAAADGFTLRILDTAGSEIASGASETIAFAPVLPAELTPAVYTVSVSAAGSDRTPDNNKAELDLNKTDLAIETDITYIGNTTRVAIFAKNQSNVPAAAVIHIQPASAEEETLTLFYRRDRTAYRCILAAGFCRYARGYLP